MRELSDLYICDTGTSAHILDSVQGSLSNAIGLQNIPSMHFYTFVIR